MKFIIFAASFLASMSLVQAQETPKKQYDGSYDTDSAPTTEQHQSTEKKKGEPDYGSSYFSPEETKKPEDKK